MAELVVKDVSRVLDNEGIRAARLPLAGEREHMGNAGLFPTRQLLENAAPGPGRFRGNVGNEQAPGDWGSGRWTAAGRPDTSDAERRGGTVVANNKFQPPDRGRVGRRGEDILAGIAGVEVDLECAALTGSKRFAPGGGTTFGCERTHAAPTVARQRPKGETQGLVTGVLDIRFDKTKTRKISHRLREGKDHAAFGSRRGAFDVQSSVPDGNRYVSRGEWCRIKRWPEIE